MLRSLQPVLETALDAVVVMRRDGTIAAWNRTAEMTFGWLEAEAVGKLMADLIIPPQHREAHCRGLERYNEGGEERVLNRRIEITAMDQAGRELPVELSITTALAGDDFVFVGFLRDISERREAEARLQRQAREAQLLFDVTRLSADTSSFEDALRACLQAICNLTTWPVGHALLLKEGSLPALVSTEVWHEAEAGEALKLREMTGDIRFGAGVGLPGRVLVSGEPAWISDFDADAGVLRKGSGFGAAFAFPVKSEGRVTAVLEFFTRGKAQMDPDLLLTVRTLGEQVGRVLERKRTEEHQRLLVNELNHRVKNTLAIVQSIANQTFRRPYDSRSAKALFEGRLAALAAAHDVLTAENWISASLEDVIRDTGVGCGADESRFHFEGPSVRLPPKIAVSLSMALHELCTNASKYGSLSNADGRVEVSWEVIAGQGASQIRVVWQEQGGPPVKPPSRRGFGSRMIERALASELGGTVQLQFLGEGVRCVIDAPLPAMRDASASPDDG
jgi:PAS domain S-box-containing protein